MLGSIAISLCIMTEPARQPRWRDRFFTVRDIPGRDPSVPWRQQMWTRPFILRTVGNVALPALFLALLALRVWGVDISLFWPAGVVIVILAWDRITDRVDKARSQRR